MMRPSHLLPFIAAALVGAAIAVIATNSGGGHSVTTTVVQPSHNATLPTSLTSGSQGSSINQIYRQDGPGVVDITVTASSGSGGFFGGSQQTQGEGAGVVYDKKGDILTDEHVVANATSVNVTFESSWYSERCTSVASAAFIVRASASVRANRFRCFPRGSRYTTTYRLPRV